MQRAVVLALVVSGMIAVAPRAVHADAPAKLAHASTDFRLVKLDPSVIGTSGFCDATLYEPITNKTEVQVRCANHPRSSSIMLTLPREVTIPRAKAGWQGFTQIEVRIDGESPGADARATFVRIVGTVEDERPSRCLCKADRDRDRPKSKAPEGFDFKPFTSVEGRPKLWGTHQLCVVSMVASFGRSRAGAEKYARESTFDPAQLPYYAQLLCTSKAGTSTVIVGATSPHSLLNLTSGMAVDVELGWTTSYHHDATGRLGSVRFHPDER